MLYGLEIAFRYLSASKAQTGLLIAGVAVGVFVFIFMSALIGGLAVFLVQRTVGDIAHVTVEEPARDAQSLFPDDGGALVVEQRTTNRRAVMRTADAFLPLIETMPGVVAVSPQIVGNGFVVRGLTTAPVSVTGVEFDKVSAIADIEGAIVEGTTDLANSNVILGSSLAEELGIGVGQVVRLQSDRDVEKSLVVSGIFELGVEGLDARAAFVSLSTARTLFELPQGISRIEVKLTDLNEAQAYSRRIAVDTGLKATPWTEGNAQLLDGLRAQASSGNLIKAFALITIVIGVASALLLSTYRRRPEIGIFGGLIGAGLGYAALSPFPVPELAPPGGLPVDVRQGAYGLAIALTAIGAILASILPARAAARVDPVKVIGQ